MPIHYDGWTKTVPYQDKVLGFAKDLFNQEITGIKSEDLPLSGLPIRTEKEIYPTTEPIHKVNFNQYFVDDILVNVGYGGLSLRDDQ